MSTKDILRACIDRCRDEQIDPWQSWRASVAAYSDLRNGSKEVNMPAWMACEAARRIGEWLRTAA